MKVLHLVKKLKFLRVYESFSEYTGLEQTIIGPNEVYEKIFHKGYDSFGLKNIKTFEKDKLKQETQAFIDNCKPEIITQPNWNNDGIIIPDYCKRVVISHGMIGKNHADILSIYKPKYDKFELYCGATKKYEEWVQKDLCVSKNNIILNAVPQFDLISNNNFYDSKCLIVPKDLQNKTSLLFFGYIGKQKKPDFIPHRKEFFDILFSLSDLINKIDAILFVHTRAKSSDLFDLAKEEGVLDKYNDILKNKKIILIDTVYPIYQYMFADLIICNGYSTTEVESVLAKKKLIIANFVYNKIVHDSFGVLAENAAIEATNEKELFEKTDHVLNDEKTIFSLKSGQENFILKNNLLLDGNSYKRVLDGILKLKV